jgi:excinuclease ABC subunit A
MVHLLLGKLKNLLIVLDEPTGSLDKKEVDSIINIISELKRNNTVVVVDHNAKLKDIADRTYYLGPKSGINGGQLISADEYTKAQIVPDVKIQIKENSKISILLESDYVDYTNEFIFYDESLNGLCGESGIGKSTILKDILPYKLDGYRYITQKPIKANSTSTIATYTDIIDEVRTYYSKITKKRKKNFLSFPGWCMFEVWWKRFNTHR